MPLHFATEPKNGTALVQKALSKLATRPSPLSERAVDFNALQVQQPHAVYDLRADAIAHGEGLASAKASGFRYLIGTGGTTVAAAEVLADANGNATVLANVNHGPYVEATARALAQVATLSAVGAGSYEVRLLRFSAIGLMALWLKPDAGGADIIYPLAPAPDGLQAERAYSVDEFLQVIVPLAQKRVGASGKLP
jgi:acyl-CoA synthetase (AMP-forming)/AMP-acid ligase II